MTKETSPGVLNGKFCFKKFAGGTLDKKTNFYVHTTAMNCLSTRSLKQHLWAKHVFTSVSKNASIGKVLCCLANQQNDNQVNQCK